MKRITHIAAILALALGVGCTSGNGCSNQSDEPANETADKEIDDMKAPADFDSIDGQQARSRAIFNEMGKVLQHPRCVNCHPTGDEPLQDDRGRPHQPMVTRGEGGMGTTGMRCTTCHGTSNFRNVPGAAAWRVAPRNLAWEDKSLSDICESLKTGGENLEPVVSFMENSGLVSYGWNPPDHYEAAPGTQARFVALTKAWVETGAHCPQTSNSE